MRSPMLFKRLAVLAAASMAFAAFTGPAHAQYASIDRVVAFGASLTDTGNSFFWLSDPAHQACGTSKNVPPYDALDESTVPDGPYAIGGHHYSNGATWIEGLARDLALPGNARPAFGSNAAKASNYAVGGARAVPDYPCRFNLPSQVNAYVADFSRTSARTLVAIEIGGNDVRDGLVAVVVSGNPDAATPYLGAALGSLGNSVYQLYGHGARKFLLLNVPDIGKAPAVRALGPTAQYVAGLVSSAYNDGLAFLRQQLAQSLPGSDIRILDIHALLDDVVADPESYGFGNVTEACITPEQPPFKCAKPDSYVFWDGIHPTKAMHAVMARQAITTVRAP